MNQNKINQCANLLHRVAKAAGWRVSRVNADSGSRYLHLSRGDETIQVRIGGHKAASIRKVDFDFWPGAACSWQVMLIRIKQRLEKPMTEATMRQHFPAAIAPVYEPYRLRNSMWRACIVDCGEPIGFVAHDGSVLPMPEEPEWSPECELRDDNDPADWWKHA